MRRHSPFARDGRDWTCTLSIVVLVLVVVTWLRLRAVWLDAGQAVHAAGARVRRCLRRFNP